MANLPKEEAKYSDILTGAKELIADESSWIKGYIYTNRNKKVVNLRNKDACCFCVIGATRRSIAYNPALRRMSAIRQWGIYCGALYYLRKALEETYRTRPRGDWDVAAFNDSPEVSHEDIIEFIDKAIELAKSEGN